MQKMYKKIVIIFVAYFLTEHKCIDYKFTVYN